MHSKQIHTSLHLAALSSSSTYGTRKILSHSASGSTPIMSSISIRLSLFFSRTFNQKASLPLLLLKFTCSKTIPHSDDFGNTWSSACCFLYFKRLNCLLLTTQYSLRSSLHHPSSDLVPSRNAAFHIFLYALTETKLHLSLKYFHCHSSLSLGLLPLYYLHPSKTESHWDSC